jgi:hypothetical protein
MLIITDFNIDRVPIGHTDNGAAEISAKSGN